LQNFIQNDIS